MPTINPQGSIGSILTTVATTAQTITSLVNVGSSYVNNISDEQAHKHKRSLSAFKTEYDKEHFKKLYTNQRELFDVFAEHLLYINGSKPSKEEVILAMSEAGIE